MIISPAGRKMTEYAVYKGETLLCVGTKWECGEFLGIKPETVRYYSKPMYLKRMEKTKNKNYPIAIKIEEDDE